MKDGWLTAAEMAKTLDVSPQGFNKNVRTYGWRAPEKMWRSDNPLGIWRPAEEGGGFEYHLSLLPSRVQAKLLAAAAPAAEPSRDDAKAGAEVAEMWAWFDRQPDKAKAKAKERLSALDMVEALLRNGQKKEVAVPLVAAQVGVAVSSIWGWYARVAGRDRKDWLPFLADRYAGRTKEAEFSFEAWEAFKEDYLRLEQPTLTACYRRLGELAEQNGWTIPAEKSVARKVEREIAAPILVLRREGPDALKRMYPPQDRDRSCFHALEAINGDGHIWDVRVEWPDGEVTRPVMVPFQDLYSNKILAWRVDKSENREVIRLELGDVVEQYGIPDYVWFDNTRAFANKLLTAGAKHRFRFKVRDEDPIGICEQLGMQVRFTLPYSGQSKPIERSFRDFATDLAKHPAFAGAYTGNSPTTKPANYGERAVPLDTFLAVVSSEIAKWNARAGRRTKIAQGRSFDDVFAESYRKASDQGLIRTATPEQARLWLLAAEGVTTNRDSGMVKILENSFWAEFLLEHRGEKLMVRYDPQNPLEGLHVYSLAGAYLGFAEVREASGFASADDARRHAQARKAWIKAIKAQANAERTMTAAQLAADLPLAEPAPVPETGNVTRLVFGNTALKPQQLPDQDEVMSAFSAAIHRLHPVSEI